MAKPDKSDKKTEPVEAEVAAVQPVRRPVALVERLLPDWTDVSRWFEPRVGFPFDERIRVEETSRDGELVIRAEIPGVDPDKDIDITVDDKHLHIRAEHRRESKTDEAGRVRSEFRYGSYERLIPIPAGVDSSTVSATYRDGILEIHLPLPDVPAPTGRRVPIAKS